MSWPCCGRPSRPGKGTQQYKLGPEAPSDVSRLFDSLLCGRRPVCRDGHGGDHLSEISTKTGRSSHTDTSCDVVYSDSPAASRASARVATHGRVRSFRRGVARMARLIRHDTAQVRSRRRNARRPRLILSCVHQLQRLDPEAVEAVQPVLEVGPQRVLTLDRTPVIGRTPRSRGDQDRRSNASTNRSTSPRARASKATFTAATFSSDIADSR